MSTVSGGSGIRWMSACRYRGAAVMNVNCRVVGRVVAAVIA